ncbi:MAG: hypothetical protein IJJ33_06495, partial [Victivallales bacterium]|nr:hypothetical protein [Victivallales bacterium]
DANKPVLAANGLFIAFYKQPDASTPYQLYRRDLTVDKDTLLTATPDGEYLDSTANRFPPAISADGISVAFATSATNLVEGKGSELSLELYAATITLEATTLWRNASTTSTDWTLLSTPVAIYAETLEQIFGAKPWYWQGNGWTQDAREIIQAGTGFIVWHASAPHNITVSALGQNAIPPTPGWNLVGPVLGAETNFVQDGDFSWDEESATWLSAPSGDATTGKAYWHFSR